MFDIDRDARSISIADGELGDVLIDSIRDQWLSFEEHFGRPPGPDDYLFFDRDTPDPQHLSDRAAARVFEEAIASFVEAGMSPAVGAAWLELDYVITPMNIHLFTSDEVREFLRAVDRHAGGASTKVSPDP